MSLFISAHILGVVVGYVFLSGLSGVEVEGFGIDDIFFIILGLIFTVIILLIITKLFDELLLYKIMDFFMVVAASFVVFYGFGFYLGYNELIAIVLALALSTFKFFNPSIKNITAVASSTGVAIMFAMFLGFYEAIIFLVVMCVYDFIAVFVTQHMITFAREFSKRNMSFSISSQEKVAERVMVKTKGGKLKEVIEERVERLELGTGDIAIPLTFTLIVFKEMLVYNIGAAVAAFIFISVFSACSLALVFSYVLRKKAFLPALPPIILGTLMGYMFAYLLGLIL
ncbi:MAG: presenilin family intramembrane aspartyl protease [Candidatus Micrarchaeia archaeon]